MAKRSGGAFQTIEELSTQVEKYKQSGFSPTDVTIISLKKNEEDLKNRTEAEIVTVESEKNLDRQHLMDYALDEETFRLYNETVKQGGYIILLDFDEQNPPGTSREQALGQDDAMKGENLTMDETRDNQLSPPGFGIDPRTPPDKDRHHGHDPFHADNSERTDIADEKNRVPSDNEQPAVDEEERLNKKQTDSTTSTEETIRITTEDKPADRNTNIESRPIGNTDTPHSPRSEEQTIIPNESLDEDRGSYR